MKPSFFKLSLLVFVLFFTLFAASAQRKQPSKKAAPAKDENTMINNNIRLKSKGFKVSEAYLVFGDETMVPDDNKVALNQEVNLLLIIEEGWTESSGRVFPGSQQVIKLSNGKEILNSEELFAAFDETGVSPEDARYISINAVVNDLVDKNQHVIVNFRVWDKKGTAEITGSYKLFIK